jgi:hypothetical protein
MMKTMMQKMKTMLQKVTGLCKSLLLYCHCKRAIRRANRRARATNEMHLVLMLGGKPVVVDRPRLRKLVNKGFFDAGITFRALARLAIYKTR